MMKNEECQTIGDLKDYLTSMPRVDPNGIHQVLIASFRIIGDMSDTIEVLSKKVKAISVHSTNEQNLNIIRAYTD